MCTTMAKTKSKKMTPEDQMLQSIFGDPPEGIPQQPEEIAVLQWTRRKRLEEVLTWAKLTFQEKEVIRIRCGLGDKHSHTPEEVANVYKMKKDRVHQITFRAVTRLQEILCAPSDYQILRYERSRRVKILSSHAPSHPIRGRATQRGDRRANRSCLVPLPLRCSVHT